MSTGLSGGWLKGYRRLASAHFDARPQGVMPDLLVIHCISLPEGCYGNGHIDALFTGTLDCGQDPSFESLRGLRVSSHFVIARTGEVTQFVDINDRAWHAGQSSFQGRQGCNDFSVGIELEGCVGDHYAAQQIDALVALCVQIVEKIPSITSVAGHSDIAPTRKSDPGPHFPWPQFISRCHLYGISLSRPVFG